MRKKWFFENLKAEALKYATKDSFKKGNYGAYQAALLSDEYDLIVEHMPKHLNSCGKDVFRNIWTFEKIRIEALRYRSKEDFRENNYCAYQAALYRRILDSVCSHMTDDTVNWTADLIQLRANKHAKREIFRKTDNNAYQAAQKMGILNIVCAHMDPSLTESYSDDEITIEASKCNTRREFRNRNESMLKAARKKGNEFYNKICTHMKDSNESSYAERELLGIIRNFFPIAKKIKDMKVKIDGKTHIKGFEIDILVGSLGIEFDGTYWHSFEGLKRRKPHWPDEDILNYHELKDQWFASKGIQILHIKEEDWIADKQLCIGKCLDFLGITMKSPLKII
jgi:hypothetical protein